MKPRQEYSKTYKDALASGEADMFIKSKWGDPKPYFDEFVKPRLHDDDMIGADIGAGFGRYTCLLESYCKRLYAVDPDLDCLQRLVDETSSVVEPVTPMEFAKTATPLDIAISFSTMCHFDKYEIAWYLKILKRMMRKGGVVVLHYMSFFGGGIKTFQKQAPQKFGESGRYIFHSPNDFVDVCDAYGFEAILNRKPTKAIVSGHMVYVGEHK